VRHAKKKKRVQGNQEHKDLKFLQQFCTNPLPPKHCCPMEAILGIKHNSGNQLKLDE
jgi:hypothetical protein